MKCGDCQYWSEMIAQCIGGGPVQAMCLGPNSEFRGKYTSERGGCNQGKPERSIYGAVDSPERMLDSEEESGK